MHIITIILLTLILAFIAGIICLVLFICNKHKKDKEDSSGTSVQKPPEKPSDDTTVPKPPEDFPVKRRYPNQAERKGNAGEAEVAKLMKQLPANEYTVFHNFILASDRGLTQIDHIVVSTYGIFVVETKNYAGFIVGGDNAEKWTKYLAGKQYSFYNPLKQNYAHIKAISNCLQIPREKIFSIIAFSNRAELKAIENNSVVHFQDIVYKILSYRTVQFSPSDLARITTTLQNANQESEANKDILISQIENNIAAQKRAVEQGICPKCGGALVKRNGKYGEFYGCSRYPKCHYIKK